MTHFHAAVWIDHHEARIVSFNPDEHATATLHHHQAVKHTQHSAGKSRNWRAPEDPAYYEEVAKSLDGFGEILIVGPANAKFAFLKHLQAKHPALAAKVVGIETVDHPSDGELTNYARAYFHKKDRTLPQL
ncbi:translational machinery protein [Parvibaculum sp.]|uniref:translational machinery protein n=1 Tax=Parvibaculum sp. TaxID=2024848 RepID=UPI002BCABC71|nr:translational machinery protein [Parvibaculum sp.]HUD51567.1 translational machinery protein [Parvibaculum sp.]